MIFLMNAGISMPVGQAVMQGASKQKRQRDDSTSACCSRVARRDLREVGGDLFGA